MYQRLNGGVGRAVYFRAPRIRPEWLARHESVAVSIGTATGQLRDISFGGMLVEFDERNFPASPDGVFAFELSVRRQTIQAGTASVVRSERHGGRLRIAAKLLAGLIEPKELRERVRSVIFREAIGVGLHAYDRVPANYRAVVSETALLLMHWRQLLEQREQQILESEPINARVELETLEALAEHRLRADWISVREKAIDTTEEIVEPSVLLAAKRLTETTVTPLLMSAPIWSHAFCKPRGYPGDFQIMNFMYESRRRGDSIFARILHELGREERLAATVRDRRRYLAQQLIDEARRAKAMGRSEIRIANLGAGPAREVEDVVEAAEAGPRLVVTLIDQDQDALEFADRNVRALAARKKCDLDLRSRFVSFRELVRNQDLLREIHGQDFIYSAGFFDYLPDRVASQLLSFLVSQLRNRGRLLIGNALAARDVRWVPEFVLDWRMIYRTPDDMRRLCKDLEVPHRLDVDFDGSGAWQFLEVVRTNE
jgi:hypothetical protein